MNALKTLAAAVAVSLTLDACAAGGTATGAARLPDGPSPGRTTADAAAVQPAMLKVSNYNWMDVVVYAVQGGIRVRLGQVTSMSSASFRLPTRMVGNTVQSVRLMVDPIGSTEGWQTDGLSIHAGQQVQFNVQNSLSFSSVMVGG
ncbi:MAG TPA: hypothetical protein VGO40_15300 [Longimicrobium sp.]|nr:hypothetical protein [Longimicrobium sp.]